MKNTKKSITFKVLFGYLLIVAFAVFAVWLVFGQIVNITKANRIGDANNQKLFLISEAVTNLYVAEGISRNIIQNENAELLPKFNAEIDTIVVLIDSLKKLYEEPSVKSELDSITHLLALKESNLKELLEIREQGATESYYARVIEKLALDEAQPENPIDRESLKNLDPSVRELVLRVEEYKRTQNWNQEKADSLFNSMKKVLINLDTQEREYQNTLDRKENELLENDRQLSNQLRSIRSEIEQEEIQKSVAQVTQSQATLEETSNLIVLVAGGAVLTILLFVVLIIKDTNRSQKYRQELESSKNYAESLLKGREQIMATVTHDLRSPLNAIIGYSDLLKNTPLNDKQGHYLGHLEKSSTYILRLVNDLLDLSKLEVGKMAIEKLPFNPKTLIGETVERNIPENDPKNLNLVFNFSENLDQQVVSDPFRIQQILTNLVSNAYKFTETGKIEVVAKINAKENAEEGRLEIAITDSGIGISKEQQKTIFEEFSQAESSIERKYGGFGLGLSITKKLTELLHGKLVLESKKGEGSTFRVSIPVKIKPQAEGLQLEKPVEQKRLQFKNPKNKRVLIVDDEVSQLALTREVIKQSGLGLETCNNPQEALKKIKKEHFDLILTDIQMPKLNGFELIRKLKSSKKTADIPVIALSGRTDVHKNLYLKKGFKGSLVKPFRAEELIVLIGKILDLEITEVQKKPQETTSKKEELYNLSDLRAFTQNDEDSLKEILHAFVISNRQNLKDFQAYSEKNEIGKIGDLSHKMLPMFKQLRINTVVSDLQELEKAKQHHLGAKHIGLLVAGLIEKTEVVLKKLQYEITN